MSQENTAPAAIGSDRWKRAEDDRRNRIRTLYDITGRSAQPYRRLLEECLSDFECTPERFRDRLTELVEEDNDRHVPDGVLGGLPAFGYGRQVREFSIIKAVRHMSDPKSVDAGFEIEVTQELARGTSSRPGAFIIPLDKPLTRNPRQMQLEHRAVTKAGAASMVGTLQAANLFIDALRARTVTMQMGATMLPGQVQDVSIPKKTAAASVGTYDLDGTASISAADPTLGAVTLSPAEFAGLSGLSWKMMVQGLPEAEAMLLNDLATGIAVEIDRQALEGDGTGSNFSGITLQADHTPTAAAITYAALLGQEAAVASANADLGPVGYVLEPGAAIALKDDATVTSVAGPVWVGGAEGTIGGIRAMYTGNLSNGSIYSGNWADLIIATWGNGVALDTSIHGDNFAKGTTSVRAILSGGLAVRHAESFSWQEST